MYTHIHTPTNERTNERTVSHPNGHGENINMIILFTVFSLEREREIGRRLSHVTLK